MIAGSSLDAQFNLVARALADEGIASRVSGALLLTGIYDLTPVPLLEVNREIGVDQDDVREHSPLFHRYPSIQSVFAVGGLDLRCGALRRLRWPRWRKQPVPRQVSSTSLDGIISI